ncbi:hypothetical protein ACR78F_07965 [Sphingobacterium spiritivorum]|uniref:hypothetical protein n=1 Tax=Sphingobacterium spiritivorum TaxID=258 RepID=UPI003DA67438
MNILNKIYSLLILIVIVLAVIAFIDRSKKIDYSTLLFTSEPLRVREIYLKNGNSDDYGNFNYPNPEYFAWKQSEPSSDNRFLNFPDSLSVTYFSYTDSLFYHSNVSIRDFNPEAWKEYKKAGEYNTFSLGIANKGWIILWCTNDSKGTTLLLKTQLKPVEPGPQDLYYIRQYNKQEYITEMFDNLSDSIRLNIKNHYYNTDYQDSTDYSLKP